MITNKKILIIIPQHNFCDEEYHTTRKVFESFDIICKVASSELLPAVGMENSIVKPDIQIESIEVKDYNAICLIGGVGCTAYWHSKYGYLIAGIAEF